jgi:hypothetical protein
MQPEISLRCSSCGAAVREPAMFCPECGKPLATASAGSEVAAEMSPPAIAVDGAAPKAEPAASKGDHPDQGPHGARERTMAGLHRASTVARGALEDNVKRVEKIHHVSTAMFEEAHYDPSLRFVLVALVLFLVAIVLLVLSKVMG